MKIENWILIALIIAAAFFLPFRYKVELTEITQQENVISRTNVLSSCNSAMAAVDQKASEVFGTEETGIMYRIHSGIKIVITPRCIKKY